MEMFGCAWITDDNMTQCDIIVMTENITTRIPLCDHHRIKALQLRPVSRQAVRQTLKHYRYDDFPGFAYIVLLPNSEIKIGYSNTVKLLVDRFKALHRSYGGRVVPLAITHGGIIAECDLHDRLAADRIPETGERFYHSPAVAAIVHELGICPGGTYALEAYAAYQPQPTVAA